MNVYYIILINYQTRIKVTSTGSKSNSVFEVEYFRSKVDVFSLDSSNLYSSLGSLGGGRELPILGTKGSEGSDDPIYLN